MNFLKKNQRGFSLVEVMVAAGIMGVMAVFFYKYFADQMKQQKSVLQRMEESNLISEIRLLLMNVDNCAESFKDQKLNLDLNGKDKQEKEIVDLKKVYMKVDVNKKTGKTKITSDLVSKFKKWIPEEQEVRYGQNNLKISNYFFSYSKDDQKIIDEYGRGEVTFLVEFDRGKMVFGSKEKSYKVPLEVQVGKDKKIETCSSLGLPAGGEAGLVAVDPMYNPGLSGKNGNQACQSKGLACAYVISTNYVVSSTGLDAPLYTPACASSYNNKDLKGVKMGVGVSNIHSCDAVLGTQKTFELSISGSTVNCSGNFVAICN